jgi:class 3 adenylate cyclase
MSESKTLTICYTDFKGSTELNNEIGNDKMYALKVEHRRVEKELIARNKGTWIKYLGDGSLSYFDNPVDAVKFLSEFQWLEAKHPGLHFWTFELKAGMAHGEVIVTKDPLDVDGIAANLAQRIVNQVQPGQVQLEAHAQSAIISGLGSEANKYLTHLGKKDLKDFPQTDLWLFEWLKYMNDDNTISKLVITKLQDANFELSNITNVPLSQPGCIFWPVVPRGMNAIHKGQLEAIKLLCFCGWETYLFVADSDQIFDPGAISHDFEKEVKEYAKRIGVSLTTVQYLSRIFDSSSSEFSSLLSKFKNLAQQFTVADVFQYEGKSYKDSQDLVMQKKILAFLRTIFTLVAFQHFADSCAKPIAIIAGEDEAPKWDKYLESRHLLSNVNLVCNPELKKEGNLIQQDSFRLVWRSKHNFIDDTARTNLTQWVFNLFVCLPQFPKTGITICNQFCKGDRCKKEPESCGRVNKLANRVSDAVKDRLGFV